MTLHLVAAPAALPLSLAELKAHLRVTDDAEDALIVGYLRAAVGAIDGAAGWLGRALITQTWRMDLDAWPACETIQIPLPPCRTVDLVTYVDEDGSTQSIVDYQVYGLGGSWPARVAHAYGSRWPGTRRQGDAISVTFTAGYGDSWNDVPEPVRAAILMMVTDLFEHRGSFISGSGFDKLQPSDTVQALLMPFRTW
jgi:uncharacterized phiE125 gp8 family phage protein